LGLVGLHHDTQKGIVRGRFYPSIEQTCLAKFELVLHPQPTTRIHHPEGTAGSGHSGDHAVHEFNAEFLGLNVGFGQFGDFADQASNLIFGLFDQ
jgi:hypothetical protein